MIAEVDWVALGGGAGRAAVPVGETAADAQHGAAAADASEPFMVPAARLSWEARRFLTAVAWRDEATSSWRVAATVRAFADLDDVNRSRLVWRGIVDGIDALETVREAFVVPAGAVYIDATFGESDVAAACAAFGWNAVVAAPHWNFRNSSLARFSVLPWSRSFKVGTGDQRCAAIKWSIPTFGSWLRACCDSHPDPHEWQLPGNTPRDYLAKLETTRRLFASHSRMEFAMMVFTPAMRQQLAPWIAESLQLAAATIAQCVAIGNIPLLSAPREDAAAAGRVSTKPHRHDQFSYCSITKDQVPEWEHWHRTADHDAALRWITARLSANDRRALAGYIRRHKDNTHVTKQWRTVNWAAVRLPEASYREFRLCFADYLQGYAAAA